MIICLRRIGATPTDWAEGAAEALLDVAPRVAVDADGCVWLDARGLDATVVAETARARLEGASVGCGIAAVPTAAQVAAGLAEGVRAVEAGGETAFLSPQPLDVLGVDERLLTLLAGVGVETCGALAALSQESVEIRFGAEALVFWRRARGEDARRLFGVPPAERARASLDFVDYVVSDPERLAFTLNALLGRLCDDLRARGLHARALVLTLALANGSEWRRTLRAARPTASRNAWLRLIRSLLEQLTVPDSVTGVALEVAASEPATTVQGDLFDAGFATASAVEAAVARLLESVGAAFVEPEASAYPLAEQRTTMKPVPLARVAERRPSKHNDSTAASLTLQLLREPRAVDVETVQRRDHEAPVRYRDSAWHSLIEVAGPDRLSGGQWDRTYAREYYRALTDEGVLIWMYHDAVHGRWYVHGYWD